MRLQTVGCRLSVRLLLPLILVLSCSPSVLAQTCALYPLGISSQALSGVASGTIISNILNGAQPGNFGWLTWAGSPSVPTLVASLTPPGDSETYINPDDTDDHVVSIGDWVQGKPGVSNSRNVRDALDELKTLDIVVPVWSQTRGQGNNADYRVCAFARVRLLSYNLPGQNRITARFLGFTSCGLENQPPIVNAGVDQTITLPEAATLDGSASDDGLPATNALSVAWSKVSGPGDVVFGDTNAVDTTATFSASGVYVLRLTASDSIETTSDEVTITANQPNRPPEADAQDVQTDEDTSLSITLTGSDPDGNTISFFIATPPSYGMLTGTPPQVTYTPTNDYSGPDAFTFKTSDGALESAEATVTITVNPVNDAPVADSQSVTNAEDMAFDIILSGADLEGSPITFQVVGGPGFGTVGEIQTNVVRYTPGADFYGEDSIRFVANDGFLNSATATVTITVLPVNDEPVAQAQEVELYEDGGVGVLLSGLDADGDPLTFAVSQSTTNGTLSGTAPNFTYAPGMNFNGMDSFSFTVSDATSTSAPAVVILTVLPVNDPPTASAGTDQLIDFPSNAVLAGAAADIDSAPLDVQWSKVAGPGEVVLEDAYAVSTEASFSLAGMYTLRFEVSDGEWTNADEVVIAVNAAPVVDAGTDRVTEPEAWIVLPGLVTDDGLPAGSPVAVAWSKVSGPGFVSWSNAASSTAAVRFSVGGDYVLRLSATDSRLLGVDDVAVSVRPAGQNQPPTVGAGEDQTVGLTLTVELEGSMADDGLPWGSVVTGCWSVVSGPGSVVFADVSDPGTEATFGEAGEYVLRLTASDGEYAETDDVVILAQGANNLPPSADAGQDQSVTGSVATLRGAASDDGLPSGILTVQWTQLSGPASSQIEDAESAVTEVNFPAQGAYVFRLTVSDSDSSATDELSITVTGNLPPIVDAGPDHLMDMFVPPAVMAYSNAPTPVFPDEWKYDIGTPGLNPDGGIFGYAMGGDESGVYVAGRFKRAGGNTNIKYLAKWDWCGWTSLPTGIVEVTDGWKLTAREDEVFASGNFKLLGMANYTYLIRWDGAQWLNWSVPLKTPWIGMRALVCSSNAVYLGGEFDLWPNTNAPVCYHVGKWNGAAWEAMGRGLNIGTSYNGSVRALTVAPNGDVYAGGVFNNSGGTQLLSIARWDGTNWNSVGGGLSGRVGASSLTTDVSALVFGPDGSLYVGGNFTNAGGVQALCLARWDGTNWHAVPGGPNAIIYALAFRSTNLFVSGVFLSTDGKAATRIACRSGTNWFGLGSGTSNGVNNNAMSMFNAEDGLYIGGLFTQAGGRPAGYMTRWGFDMPPSLAMPEPVTVWAEDAAGASVVLTAMVRERCNLRMIWNIDGGPAEYTNEISRAFSPTPVSFTNVFPVGLHTVTLTIENGKTPAMVGLTSVAVMEPVSSVLAGSIVDDGLPAGSTSALWTVVSGPTNATLACATCPVTAVSFVQAGTYVFRLTGSDSELAAADECTIQIRPLGSSNLPPSVAAGPDRTILVTESAELMGTASDDGLPDGSALGISWSQVSGPGIATFLCTTCAATTVTFDLLGTYTLRLTATDGELAYSDEVVIHVQPDLNQPPVVNAGTDQVVMFAEGESIVSAPLDGSVSDDGLPSSWLLSQWSVVDGPSSVVFKYRNGAYLASFGAPGVYTLRLTGDDSALTAADEVTVTVLAYVPLPALEITSPTNTQQVMAPSTILGSVSSPVIASWELQYRLVEGATNWLVLGTGSTSVADGELGTLDPTLLLNGTYELRLTAADLAGRTSECEPVSVVVDGNMKVGLFTVSFEDLSVPLAGIPIQVVRTYDSRNAMAGKVGDFGIGWTLSLKDVRLQKNRALGTHWKEEITGFVGGLGIPRYELAPVRDRMITITLADNSVYRFRAKLNPSVQSGVPIVAGSLVFEPLPGTYGTLAVEGDNDVQVMGDVPYYDPFGGLSLFSGFVDLVDPFNGSDLDPQLFRFTTADGTAYIVHETEGLKKVVDLNGNEVQYTSSGVYHSSGESVQFARDAQGRITHITDPAGNTQVYGYDTNGNLSAFTDRTTNTTTLQYSSTPSPHLLRDILDARGVRAVRSEYDESGRLIRQTDADGNPIVFTHDIENRRETVTDRLGHVVVHEYDDRGNVVRTIDAMTNVTIHVYDDLDNEIATVDALGHVTTFTYDGRGNKLTETLLRQGSGGQADSFSNTVTYTYNALNQPLTITDARGNTTWYIYDARGNLVQEIDALDNVTTYAYDTRGNMLSRTDALSNRWEYGYDTLGRQTSAVVRSQASSVERQESFTYDANGNQLTRTWQVSSVEFQVSNTYDSANRLISVVQPDGSVTRTLYNPIGKESARIDALGRETAYEYNDRGNLVLTTYPDGTTESAEYDEEGRKVSSTDRLGRTTEYVYDALGRLTDTIQADGGTQSTVYDEIGRVVTSIDALGNETHYEYEDCPCSGRQATVIDALGHETDYDYDENGNRIAMLDANGHETRFEYDALNRQTNIVFHDGTSKATAYDVLGRRIAETDQAGLTTQYRYDALGRLTNVVDALSQVTSYGYDQQGNLVAQTDANGHTTTFEYDSMGRRVKRTLPEGQVETYAYDAVGNMTNKVDFNGRVTTYDFDRMNRMTARIPDASFGASNIVFGYNAMGQRTNMSDQSGVTTYAYDSRDRLVEKATPQGTLAYGYDAQGNLTNIVIMDQASSVQGQVSYSYDPLNRLHTVLDPRIGLTVYNYDNVGNLQSFIYPNGVSHAYQYDELNRLTNMSVAHLATPIAGYAYALNPSGHRTQVRELGGRTAIYGYDNLYRLTQETISGTLIAGQIAYSYDAVGNRLSRNSTVTNILEKLYDYDMNDRLGSDSYDAAGNTKAAEVRGQSSDVSFTYDYDFENRLLSAQSASSAVALLYDGDGNRVAKTVTDGGGSRRTWYLVDDRSLTGYAQVLLELTSDVWPLTSGVASRAYTYGLDLISQTRYSSLIAEHSFYGYDGHGNVRCLTDTNGYITDTYDYDAFGTLIEQRVWDPAVLDLVIPSTPTLQSSITPNLYLYCGEQFDPDLGLYFLRARYMDTDRGRFWTMDSFEGFNTDPISLHKYLYADANPAVYTDPTGHFSYSQAMMAVEVFGQVLRTARAILRLQPPWTKLWACVRQAVYYKAGIPHVYMFHGETPWGQNPPGVGWGFGQGGPYDEKYFNPVACGKCYRAYGSTLQHGSVAGTKCRNASDAQIWGCIKSYPGRKPYDATTYNCFIWAVEAQRACCLNCGAF